MDNLKFVEQLMMDFARITGLEPATNSPKRYLWTDAFAVCNYLELFRQTTDVNYLKLATCLVDQVHHILGQYRSDDFRNGWISGLDREEGEKHPTIAGLRIGKKFNERKINEPVDEQMEWEQDGQYYHYLTKWMHALHQLYKATDDSKFIEWAIELAKISHKSFVINSSTRNRRMYWKMSIDLSYPLVSSMGQHDPLDGFVTYNELQMTKNSLKLSEDLNFEIKDMYNVLNDKNLITNDPLGLGGLLFDSCRISRVLLNNNNNNNSSYNYNFKGLMLNILNSSLIGLKSFINTNFFNYPGQYRLAFRELGLSIGLKAVKNLKMVDEVEQDFFNKDISLKIDNLMNYSFLAEEIDKFWIKSENQELNSWKEHQEINMVMLATSLAPDSFLLV